MADLEEITELTLGLPGGGARRERAAPPPPPEAVSGGGKFVKSEKLTSQKRGLFVDENDGDDEQLDLLSSNNGRSSLESAEATSQAPARKVRAIGWPPVRSFRKKVFAESHDFNYVKVAADGAPYLRKVDLENYNSYQELLIALKGMFSCFNILGNCDQKKFAKFQVKPMVEYVPTYEDKDGDLMLVGDVPWKMFTESCKRIRLMKSSEAVGLATRTTHNI